MVNSKNKKRIITFLIGFIVVVISLFIYLHYWMNKTFPDILNQNPERVYDIRYDGIYYSVFANTIELSDIKIKPHNIKSGADILKGSIENVSITKVNFFKLLKDKKITTQFIEINYPKINIVSEFSDKKLASNSQSINKFWGDFYYSIELQNFKINHGEITINSGSEEAIDFYSHDINIELSGVKIDSTLKSNPLPFTYDNFKLNTAETYAKMDEFYQVYSSSFKASSTELSIHDVKLNPIDSKEIFNRKLKEEKDFIELNVKLVKMEETKWGFYNDSLWVQAKGLNLDSVIMKLSRNKLVQDDNSIKKLYSSILRDLSFYVSIDSFNLDHGEIEYQEKIYADQPSGKVTFKKVKIDGANLNNFQYNKNPLKTSFHFKSAFCESGDLDAILTFNISDLKDRFQLKGTLNHFNAASINIFTEPVFNLTMNGHIEKIDYLISGSDFDASATVGINYQDLKLIYRDDEKGNKKILKNLVSNVVVKNRQNLDQLEYAEVYVLRDKSKSIYNQIWISVREALKKIILKT